MTTRLHPSDRVARRRVFYIPGFDPLPARRYRELYRSEGAKQAATSGYAFGQKPGAGPGAWRARTRIDGDLTEARIEVLPWSDIAKSATSGSVPATYAALVRTVWTYVGSGTFRRLTWLRKGPVIAALYPIVMLIAQLLVALIVAAFVGGQLGRLVHWATGLSSTGWVVGLPLIWLILQGFRRMDGRLYAYYLMHDFAYAASEDGRWPDPLNARIAVFTDRIAAALMEEGIDEVLVIGHSSGAQVAVSAVADLVRSARVPDRGPTLSLLTLGHAIPMQSFLRGATKLRADLQLLSESHGLTWVDVSAPADGCSFALCDPVAVSGVASGDSHQPLVLSAAFSQTLSPETWKALRWRFFRLHFQYLCAFDKPGDYDYFAITAGPMTLNARFRGRKPSRSRIDVAASRHRSRAA